MAKSLSTCLVLVCALAFPGCVSPADDLDEYLATLPEEPPPPVGDYNCADITGTFFFSINPKPLADGTLVHYQADVVYDDVNATVDVTLTPLDVDTQEPVPGVTPDEWTGLAVDCDNDATFTIALDNVVIPGEANSILLDTPVTVCASITAHIVDADHWCGELPEGSVKETGSMLGGSTIGAVRGQGPPWPDPPLYDCAGALQ